MKPSTRELWIISGVLVPFSILVVLGFAWPQPSAPAPEPTRLPIEGPQAQPPPRAIGADAGPPPRLAPEARVEEAQAYPAELDVPLRAVEAEVKRCLVDQGTRAPRRVDVEVAFHPTRSGTFAEVSVRPSWQDPYLEACVEDVFAEVHWVPSGRETFTPAKFTFRLDR
jgi:hypothetical protein